MKIIVTGGAGFIGSHIIKKLAEQNKGVVVVDSLPSGRPDNLFALGLNQSDFELRQADLTNYKETKDALDGAETVFHMAARVGGLSFLHGNRDAELITLETNLTIDANVFRACQELGVDAIIYPSSVSVYPILKQQSRNAIFSEDDFRPSTEGRKMDFKMSVDPDGGYGMAKLLAEVELHAMSGIKHIGIARIFSAYGENESINEKAHVISRFMKAALHYPEEQIVIWGDGSQSRDYVYAGDCAEAFVRLAEVARKEDYPVTVNIGAGVPVSMKELAEKIIAISGKDTKPIYEPGKAGGPVSRTADITRAKELLGWEPKVGLEEGLERTYRWILGRIHTDL